MIDVTFDDLRKDGERIVARRKLISLDAVLADHVLKHSNGTHKGVKLVLSTGSDQGHKSKVIVFIPGGLSTEDLRYFDRFEPGSRVHVEGYYRPDNYFLGAIEATFWKIR